MGRWFVCAVVFTFAFVVNPAYIAGCTADTDPSPAQRARAEAELKAKLDIIDGTASWRMTQGSEEYEVFLALEHAKAPPERAQRSNGTHGLLTLAHACGNHTLYNRASACATAFELPLEGTLSVQRIGDDAATIVADLAVTGTLSSLGYDAHLVFGGDDHLTLSLDDEDSYVLQSFRGSMLGSERIDFDYSRF